MRLIEKSNTEQLFNSLKEDFWNPGKYFQLLQDMEDIDTAKWNNSTKEERDAMVLPYLKEFWNKYKEFMTDDDIYALFDDLEDSNYHTEYRLLRDIIYGKNNMNESSYKDDPDFENTVKRDFRLFLMDKYGDELYKDVTNDDINEYFTGMFYDIEDEDDLDASNEAEKIIRNEYNCLDSRDFSDDQEYDDGDTNWSAEEEADAIERMERRYGNMDESEDIDYDKKLNDEFGYCISNIEKPDEDSDEYKVYLLYSPKKKYNFVEPETGNLQFAIVGKDAKDCYNQLKSGKIVEVNRKGGAISESAKQDKITIKLDGETKIFNSLNDALNYILEAISYCYQNYSECRRDYSIYNQLKSGSKNCSDELDEAVKPKEKKEDKRLIMQQGNVTCIKENESYLVYENESDNEVEHDSEESAMQDFLERCGVDPNNELEEKEDK